MTIPQVKVIEMWNNTLLKYYGTQILWDEYDFLMHDTKKQRSQVGNNIAIFLACFL